MEVMIVNGKRHLINDTSTAVDLDCQIILAGYPKDALIEFDEVGYEDVISKVNINNILNNK